MRCKLIVALKKVLYGNMNSNHDQNNGFGVETIIYNLNNYWASTSEYQAVKSPVF
jgi:hypothetical protein